MITRVYKPQYRGKDAINVVKYCKGKNIIVDVVDAETFDAQEKAYVSNMEEMIDMSKENDMLRKVISGLKCRTSGHLKRQFDEKGGVVYKQKECSHCDVCLAKEKL